MKKGLVIYEPRGRAAEYCPLALNLYVGCGHGCVYCYAPKATFIDRQEFKKAAPRPDIIKKLEKDAPKARADGAKGNVLISFTSDCYQPIDEIHQLTRKAILILHANGFNVSILTKGGDRAHRDFDLYQPGDQFGTTLTFLSADLSKQWEPGSAPPHQRLFSLRKAHELGIETWASLEPVIDPAETLEIIRQTHTFVDHFKVGKINYTEKLPAALREQVEDIDWTQFANAVIALLEEYKCDYYLKNDLRRYLWTK